MFQSGKASPEGIRVVESKCGTLRLQCCVPTTCRHEPRDSDTRDACTRHISSIDKQMKLRSLRENPTDQDSLHADMNIQAPKDLTGLGTCRIKLFEMALGMGSELAIYFRNKCQIDLDSLSLCQAGLECWRN